jgi:drug/metabolite transporter (DMT)-like permease
MSELATYVLLAGRLYLVFIISVGFAVMWHRGGRSAWTYLFGGCGYGAYATLTAFGVLHLSHPSQLVPVVSLGVIVTVLLFALMGQRQRHREGR